MSKQNKYRKAKRAERKALVAYAKALCVCGAAVGAFVVLGNIAFG